MPASRIVASNSVSSYSLDGDAVLFDRGTGRLYVLNETAAAVWAGLSAGEGYADAAGGLSRRTGTPLPEVLRDCQALLDQWVATGLAHAEGAPRIASEAVAQAGTAASATLRPDERQTFQRSYRLLDFRFRLVGEPAVEEVVDALLGHLSVPAEDGIGEPAHVLAIAQRDDGWALLHANGVLGECEELEELAPLIHANVQRLAYEGSGCLFAIHGAAVARGSSCVVLPGLPGSGKSTLVAALVAAGFDYCGDDIAILSGNPVRLRAVPTCIGLKRGAWPVLEPVVPALGDLPVHRRADRKSIKYLVPPEERIRKSYGEDFRVAAAVFPRYVRGSDCELLPIRRSAALARAAEAGYDLPGRLDADWVRSVVAWLQTLSCYELTFADIDRAVESLGKVLE